MTVSKASIVNLALSLIRESGRVGNPLVDPSTQARTAELWYDPARLQALAEFDFGFARRRRQLAVHSEPPPQDWAFRYQYPADCVQPRYIENPLRPDAPPIRFEVEVADDNTRCVLTNIEEPRFVFTFDQDSTTFFTPHFVLGLAYLLGHYMSGAITGKGSIQRDMMDGYRLAMTQGAAIEANATAASTTGAPDAEWISFRGAGVPGPWQR